MNCTNCNKPLEPVVSEESAKRTNQYFDSLEVILVGGYGMFTDMTDSIEQAAGKNVFCKDCCDLFIETFPGAAKKLKEIHLI